MWSLSFLTLEHKNYNVLFFKLFKIITFLCAINCQFKAHIEECVVAIRSQLATNLYVMKDVYNTNLLGFLSFHVAHSWDKEMTKYKITSAREIECACFSWSNSRTPFITQQFYSYCWLFTCLHGWGKNIQSKSNLFSSTSSFAFMIKH
jgi:hypothetical protein